MSVLLDPLDVVVAELEEADDHEHIVCCRRLIALCGEELDEYDQLNPELSDDEVCIRCLVIEEAGVPCGAPACRLRRAWRGWLS